MTDIKWALWNCSGLLPSSSAAEKTNFLCTAIDANFDILILVETHHKNIEDVTCLSILKNNYDVLHTEADINDTYGGIIVLVHKNLRVIEENELIKGRLLNFKIKDTNQQYNVSAIYNYSGNRATSDKLKSFTEILKTYHSPADHNILLGDFNFVDNDLDRTNKTKLGQNNTDKSLTQTWLNFTDELDLSDPFRTRNPKKRMYSYIHTRDKAKSRLDRIYLNDENCNSITHYKHIHTPFIKAHRIVTFTLTKQGDRGPGYWKMNTSILNDRPYAMIVENTVTDVRNLNTSDPVEKWLILIQTITIETQVYCKSKRHYEKKIKAQCEKKIETLEQHPQLNSNEQLHKEYEYCLDKLNNWHKQQVEGHQTRIKTQPKLEHGEPNIAFFAEIEKKSSKKKMITHLMNEEGEMKNDTSSLMQIATDFYTKLYARKNTNQQTADRLLRNIKKKITPEQMDTMDALITKEELTKAVMRLQKGKSPGPDGIPAEFYQKFWHLLHDLYLSYIEQVKNSLFPEE